MCACRCHITQFSLRSVSDSRSAYAFFSFASTFFSSYSAPALDPVATSAITVRLLAKSLLVVFRSLPNMERTVSKCEITLETRQNYIGVRLSCRFGIIQSFKLHYEECETIHVRTCYYILNSRLSL